MSTAPVDARLRGVALIAVAATLLCSVVFFVVQNRFALTGGSVAWSKSLWLGLALLFWLILPAIVLFDGRAPAELRRPFMLLLLLMAARGVTELIMLYVFRNWSPRYGIAHDVLCLAVLWACGIRFRWVRAERQDATPVRWLLLHCFVTGALFIPEIYYAWYMQAHFTTAGENPIYFVPDDGSHSFVLAVTAAVDVLASLYLAFFLHGWLYGKAQRSGT